MTQKGKPEETAGGSQTPSAPCWRRICITLEVRILPAMRYDGSCRRAHGFGRNQDKLNLCNNPTQALGQNKGGNYMWKEVPRFPRLLV